VTFPRHAPPQRHPGALVPEGPRAGKAGTHVPFRKSPARSEPPVQSTPERSPPSHASAPGVWVPAFPARQAFACERAGMTQRLARRSEAGSDRRWRDVRDDDAAVDVQRWYTSNSSGRWDMQTIAASATAR